MIEAISIFLTGIFLWFALLYIGAHFFLWTRFVIEKFKNRKKGR